MICMDTLDGLVGVDVAAVHNATAEDVTVGVTDSAPVSCFIDCYDETYGARAKWISGSSLNICHHL